MYKYTGFNIKLHVRRKGPFVRVFNFSYGKTVKCPYISALKCEREKLRALSREVSQLLNYNYFF